MRNKLAMLLTVLVASGFTTKAWCQAFNPTPGAFKVHYASNLNIGDSFIDISNSGTAGSEVANSICINTYVFDQSAGMLACCSCKVAPNSLVSYSVKNQLISNDLTPEIPNSIIVKLLASFPASPGAQCNASSPTGTNLAPGMLAWGTALHALPTSPVTYGITETEFTAGGLSQSELTELTSDCDFIQTEGQGFGICKQCSIGGL
jgi:hypothetical protein